MKNREKQRENRRNKKCQEKHRPWQNAEGYNVFTAYQALLNIEREKRKKSKPSTPPRKPPVAISQ